MRVLITVRTYPTPDWRGVEVSCTAGVTEQGDWIRLFPVPYRFLTPDQRFKKYQWIDVEVSKASDPRPESYHPNLDSIRIVRELPSGGGSWAERRQQLEPVLAHCLCCLTRERNEKGFPTLGLFKPARIERLIIKPDSAEWTEAELARLRQYTLFEKMPARELEKIPFTFSYKFWCPEDSCRGHTLSCTDWEMAQTYRSWRKQYGNNWESKFRERWERDMIDVNDTHFYVGTVHGHPHRWIIVGLFYPKPTTGEVGRQARLLP